MKSLFFLMTMFTASIALAEEAAIHAISEEGEAVMIALVDGELVSTGVLDRDLSIKDIRDGRLTDQCYTGPVTKAEDVVEALVEAANGDGDSYAEIISLAPVGKKGREIIKSRVQIEDESGVKKFSINFPNCR